MLIAIGGVATGVAALLLSLSIVQGFSEQIEEKIIGWGAHVQVSSMRFQPLASSDTLVSRLPNLDERILSAIPVVEDFALLRVSSQVIDGVVVVGRDKLPDYIATTLVDTEEGSVPIVSDDPGLVIGKQLAEQLGLQIGDPVVVLSMRSSGSEQRQAMLQQPRIRQFHVQSIFETSLAEYDQLYVFADLPEARRLFGFLPDEVSRVDVLLNDVQDADLVADRINEAWGFPLLAESIYDVRRPLFAWVDLQEQMIPLVLSVIMLVGAFNIIGTLLMIILEKTREIGIMIGMGTSQRRIRSLFLRLGIYIGIVGTGIGEVVALVLALVQKQFGVIQLPPDAYYLATAPVSINPMHFFVVGIVAILLCMLAALIPAHFASRIEPIRAIRFR